LKITKIGYEDKESKDDCPSCRKIINKLINNFSLLKICRNNNLTGLAANAIYELLFNMEFSHYI
jgi:hypothetical protein